MIPLRIQMTKKKQLTNCPSLNQTRRGTAGCHAGHGTEQVKCSLRVAGVSLRQSSARRWREMSASRSEAGQLIGHAETEHSVAFLLSGFSPSTKRVESLDLLKGIRLRALSSSDELLSTLASISPQSNGSIFPSEKLVKSIEKFSCLATQSTVRQQNA